MPPNNITGANSGGARQLPLWTRWTARVGQFCRSAAGGMMNEGSQSNWYRRLLGLCLPPFLMGLLDGTLTLAGQAPSYWEGYYWDASESHPMYRLFLEYHPMAFAAGLLVLELVFAALILLLPQTLALATSFAVASYHCWGASTWLLRLGLDYRSRVALFALTGLLVAICVRWGWGARPPADEPLGESWGWPVQLLGIVVLVGIFVFLVLSRS